MDEPLPPVAISARVLNELRAHARETDPEECCGLVVSDGLERYARVVRCHNEMARRHEEDPEAFPALDNRTGYYISPRDVVDVLRETERTGANVTAVYHSHVGTGAYLSDLDRRYLENELFPFPDADQIVLSVFEHRVREIKIFVRDGDDFTEHLVPAEPS